MRGLWIPAFILVVFWFFLSGPMHPMIALVGAALVFVLLWIYVNVRDRRAMARAARWQAARGGAATTDRSD